MDSLNGVIMSTKRSYVDSTVYMMLENMECRLVKAFKICWIRMTMFLTDAYLSLHSQTIVGIPLACGVLEFGSSEKIEKCPHILRYIHNVCNPLMYCLQQNW